LKKWAKQNSIQLPKIPDGASNNAHMFYLVCSSQLERDSLITNLKLKNVNAVFHYQSLHRSPFFVDKHDGRELPSSDRYSECLVRLPFYYELEVEEVLNRFI
jgi:dTDP-4-amino-4,6-dideoxygalactose transaminase